MPCDCSHYEPNEREQELAQAAQSYLFLLTELEEPVSEQLIAASENGYGYGKGYDQCPDWVQKLCERLSTLPEEQFREIVNKNLDNPATASLLSWWSRHKKADRQAAEREKALEEFNADFSTHVCTHLRHGVVEVGYVFPINSDQWVPLVPESFTKLQMGTKRTEEEAIDALKNYARERKFK